MRLDSVAWWIVSSGFATSTVRMITFQESGPMYLCYFAESGTPEWFDCATFDPVGLVPTVRVIDSYRNASRPAPFFPCRRHRRRHGRIGADSFLFVDCSFQSCSPSRQAGRGLNNETGQFKSRKCIQVGHDLSWHACKLRFIPEHSDKLPCPARHTCETNACLSPVANQLALGTPSPHFHPSFGPYVLSNRR